MRLKIPQQIQLSSLCLANHQPSSLCHSASSTINPFSLPSPFRWGETRKRGRQAGSGLETLLARDLRPNPSLPSPREYFVKSEQKRHSLSIGPKITLGGFAGDVVSASPTRSHPAVLFLLPVSLATPQLALVEEPGCCLLRQDLQLPRERFLKLIGLRESRRWGQMLMRDRVLCVQL